MDCLNKCYHPGRAHTCITFDKGIQLLAIIVVTPDEVYLYGIDYWKDALKYSEMLIYVNVAIQSGLKSVIEDKLKKSFCLKMELHLIK